MPRPPSFLQKPQVRIGTAARGWVTAQRGRSWGEGWSSTDQSGSFLGPASEGGDQPAIKSPHDLGARRLSLNLGVFVHKMG